MAKITCTKCSETVEITDNSERMKILRTGEAECNKCGSFKVSENDRSYLMDGMRSFPIPNTC